MKVIDLLQQIGIKRLGDGPIIKGLCPFHSHNGQRTFWLRRETGAWGCWSERCPQHHNRAQWMPKLLELRGFGILRAARVITQLELTAYEGSEDKAGPQSPDDLEDGRIREKHLAAWRVNWFTVDQVCKDVKSVPRDEWQFDVPLTYWCDTIAHPGAVEHDFWTDLGWLPRKRKVSATSLQDFHIGFDRQRQQFIFPLHRFDNGKLEGVGRRHPESRYIVTASVIPPGEPGYTRQKARTAQVLWGFRENAERVAHAAPLIVTEGYLDVLHIHDAGWAAVAKLRSKLAEEQVDFLRKLPCQKILWPDMDPAGLKGAIDDVIRLQPWGAVRVVVDVPPGKDPGDLTIAEINRCLGTTITGQQFLSSMPNILAKAKGR